jgi:nitrite reductase (NADH) small subunit
MTRACHIDDIPLGEGRTVRVDGRRIALFRTTTGWYAIDHACPHAGGPLSDGIVADSCVICPLHNRRFDLSTGEQVGGTDRVTTYEVRERDGMLEVRPAVAVLLDEAA